MFSRSSSAHFLPHQTVRLVRGGRDYFDLLDKMIREAVLTLHLQFYIFEEDDTGKKVACALLEAAARNVKVFVLVDGYASQKLSKEFIQNLRDAGIYFRRFEPFLKSKHYYFGRRLHHKVVVADGERSLVSGLNISDRYNDTPAGEAWLDWAVYAEGVTAGVLETICNRRTRNRGFMKISAASLKPHPAELVPGDSDVRVRINDWVNNKRQITSTYLEMFRVASSHLIIMSPYFMPGHEFRKRMRLAVARGIKIKVILAGISDISISKNAERFVYRWLFRNQIEIYEYQRKVLHGKIAVCDAEWVTVGSYNMNDLSAQASIELNLDVNNIKFAKHVEETLLDIIQKDCKLITEEDYKVHTSFSQRVYQRIAYESMRLLLFLFTFYFRRKR
jgi:cardiolipin synthase